MAHKLTDEQTKMLAQWVADGLGLSEIQKRMGEEWSVSLTYMEVRFLIDDLNLELADKPAPQAGADHPSPSPSDALDLEPEDAESVRVEVDRVVQPGAVASGSVRFSDGMKATWAVDGYGRLMLQADQKGYKPSQEDVEAFQMELQRQLERSGM